MKTTIYTNCKIVNCKIQKGEGSGKTTHVDIPSSITMVVMMIATMAAVSVVAAFTAAEGERPAESNLNVTRHVFFPTRLLAVQTKVPGATFSAGHLELNHQWHHWEASCLLH